MKTLLSFTGAAMAAAILLVPPAQAGKGDNMPVPGAPVGPAAAPGDLGSAVMHAVIKADGSLARGEGVVSAGYTAGNNYFVVFGRDITACSYTATVGSSAQVGTEPAGFVTVVGLSGQPAGIYYETWDGGGAEAQRGVHIQVICGR